MLHAGTASRHRTTLHTCNPCFLGTGARECCRSPSAGTSARFLQESDWSTQLGDFHAALLKNCPPSTFSIQAASSEEGKQKIQKKSSSRVHRDIAGAGRANSNLRAPLSARSNLCACHSTIFTAVDHSRMQLSSCRLIDQEFHRKKQLSKIRTRADLSAVPERN